MIEVFDLKAICKEPALRESMHRLRHTMFVDRNGWDVPNIGGFEIDQYDRFEINPVYLIARSPEDEVLATCRLMPSLGPYMIKEHFTGFWPWGSMPARHNIWESNRITVDHRRCGRQSFNYTAAIMAAHCEFGWHMGVREVFGVFNTKTLKILTRLGAPTSRQSESFILDGETCQFAFFALSKENHGRLMKSAKADGAIISHIHIERREEAA